MDKNAKQHKDKTEAIDSFLEAFGSVTKNDRWMAAVWVVEDDQIKLKMVTTHQFPNGDMLSAVGQLGTTLHKMSIESMLIKKPDPLPQAFPRQWTPDADKETEEGV